MDEVEKELLTQLGDFRLKILPHAHAFVSELLCELSVRKTAKESIVDAQVQTYFFSQYQSSHLHTVTHASSSTEEKALLALAQSYFDLRRFQQCAFILSPSSQENKIKVENCQAARFLRNYALYLDAEKRAGERALENAASAINSTGRSATEISAQARLNISTHIDPERLRTLASIRAELCDYLCLQGMMTFPLPTTQQKRLHQKKENRKQPTEKGKPRILPGEADTESSSFVISSSSFSHRLEETTSPAKEVKEASAEFKIEESQKKEKSESSLPLMTSQNVTTGWAEIKVHDPYSLYVLAVVLKRQGVSALARKVAIVSLQLQPLNWSAWKLLAELCDSRAVLNKAVADYSTFLKTDATSKASWKPHWMVRYFFAHALLSLQENMECLQVLNELRSVFGPTSYLLEQYALVFYQQRDFENSERFFEALRAREPHRLQSMDMYSNILYVGEKRAKLSQLAMDACRIDYYRPETCCILGNYYSMKSYHERAVLYFQRALKLNSNYLSAWTLMGHEYVEMKNTKAAIFAYRKAIDINPRDYRAWHGLGQVYEVLFLYMYALYYYRKAVALRPYDGRMWIAMGICYEKLPKWPEACKCYLRAVAISDSEVFALHRLACIAKDQMNDRDAAARYYEKMLKAYDKDSVEGDETVDALQFLAHYYRDADYRRKALRYAKRLQEFAGKESEATLLIRELLKYEGKESMSLESLMELEGDEESDDSDDEGSPQEKSQDSSKLIQKQIATSILPSQVRTPQAVPSSNSRLSSASISREDGGFSFSRDISNISMESDVSISLTEASFEAEAPASPKSKVEKDLPPSQREGDSVKDDSKITDVSHDDDDDDVSVVKLESISMIHEDQAGSTFLEEDISMEESSVMEDMSLTGDSTFLSKEDDE